MKRSFIILSILLGIISIASISYSISLYQENRELTAKQDSLYTLSEAQKVFKENGLKLIDDVTVSIQDMGRVNKNEVVDGIFITMQQLSKGDNSGLFCTLRIQAMNMGDLPKPEIREIPLE